MASDPVSVSGGTGGPAQGLGALGLGLMLLAVLGFLVGGVLKLLGFA